MQRWAPRGTRLTWQQNSSLPDCTLRYECDILLAARWVLQPARCAAGALLALVLWWSLWHRATRPCVAAAAR